MVSCPLVALLPFLSNRGGVFHERHGVPLAYSHMAGALLALEHFRNNDLPLILGNTTAVRFFDDDMKEQVWNTCRETTNFTLHVFDTSDNQFTTSRVLANLLVPQEDHEKPCALLGPYGNNPAGVAVVRTSRLCQKYHMLRTKFALTKHQ